MKKLFTVLGLPTQYLVSLMFLMMSSNVWACRCSMDEASLIYFVEAKYVFRAGVASASDCGENNKYEYRLEIDDVYKGELASEITVYTDCITSCAFQLEAGKTYLFFTDLINNNIGFCEYKLTRNDKEYRNTRQYLDLIQKTKLDFLTIKDSEDRKMGELQIRDGKLDGVTKIYYPNGDIRMEGLFIKGVATGNFEITLQRSNYKDYWQGDYKEGMRIGMWRHITYQNDGKKLYEHVFYEDGEIVDRQLMDADSQIERYSPKKATENNKDGEGQRKK